MLNVKWTAFADAYPQPNRPLLVAYTATDDSLVDMVRPSMFEFLKARGLGALPEAEWFHIEFGQVDDEGFGLAYFYTTGPAFGKVWEKASHYHHAELKASGLWCYVSDIAMGLFPTLTKMGAQPVVLVVSGELDNSVIMEVDGVVRSGGDDFEVA